MYEHTPGPWKTDKWGHVVDSKGRKVVSYGMALGHGYGDGEIEANDRLIAAAPDLLKACQKVVEHYGDPAKGKLFGLRAAIAKATGK